MMQEFTKINKQAARKTTNGNASLLISMAVIFAMPFFSAGQDVLTGLTSNGGSEGRGTAFSIKTNGTNFSVIKSFADWGKTPNGNLLKYDNGNFYGMASTGGTYNDGTIFSMTPAGVITILRHLNSLTDGASPQGELTRGNDGNFYGLNSAGGTNTYGTIFRMSPSGAYTVLRHLSYATDGTNPRGHLVLAKDGNFYGITTAGGANGVGTIFKITPAGAFTVLRHLNKTTDGSNCYGSLTEGKDGYLYGITNSGGSYSYGTIFKITTGGSYTVLRHLNGPTDGGFSQTDLLQATDGNFYGTCYSYGTKGNGTIFRITPAGTYTVLRHLASMADGGYPYGNLFQHSDGFLYGMNRTGGTGNSGTAYKISIAGAYTLLHSFISATEGSTANGGFISGNDGNLYALTSYGGLYTGGTVIKMTTAGVVTTLVNLNGAAQGNAPLESLVKGKDSAYYGLASSGGAFGFGTIFKICGGSTTTIYSFNRNADGGSPRGSLTLANDGNFYGMTYDGGAHSMGTIFKITPAGSYSVLRHFTSATDGGSPMGSLVQATDGLLYGMTNSGGTGGGGTIFKISLSGTFTIMRNLAYATDGSNPEGSLLQGADGNFYGMTSNNARIFKITPAGVFTILRTLNGTADGYYPLGSLVLHSDGNFYGTNSIGGTYSGGTLFKISPAGAYSVLRHLNATTDGKNPKGNLLKGIDGNLYGMTSAGGTYNAGTIFKITTTGSYSVLRHFNMATDGGNAFGSFILAPVNSNLVAAAQSITTNEDVSKAITLAVSGGSPLSFNIVTSPANGKITGSGASRTYTPNLNFAGKDSFAFNVGVGCITSAPAFVKITVTAVADTPVLAIIGNKTIALNATLAFTASAKDADGQLIAYSLIGAPAGAAINSISGAFSWKPTATGNYTFKVRATDNGSPAMFDEEQITVTVTATFALVANSSSGAPAGMAAAIFPNPVDDRCFVKLQSPVTDLTLRIIDLNGGVVSSTFYRAAGKNPISVNAATLIPGTYIVQLQTSTGSQSIKMIKK